MEEILSGDSRVILLLCAVFGKEKQFKPLTLGEYNKIVQWLIDNRLRPENLLDEGVAVEAAAEAEILPDRLHFLLGRGVQLGFSVEEWQRNGLWVIARSDEQYPKMLKAHLKEKAPPVLFGCGDPGLLELGGIGIVGSRNVDQCAADFTRETALLCARQNVQVVSGGARGVDQISMQSALERGGKVTGIVADNLLRKTLERSARRAITDGELVLVSPYHPQAGFTVGSAMGRNKLIYALSNYGLVVSAEYNKGGTWSGAAEELRRESGRPLFVRTGSGVPEGNNRLLEKGAIPWPELSADDDLYSRLAERVAQQPDNRPPQQMDLFD